MPQRDDFPFMDLREWDNRIRVTASCRDCDYLPRVQGAGQFTKHGETDVQIMHNGIKVLKDGYYGPEISLIIQLLRGIHEPQEEKIFAEILPYMPAGATMVELGSYWAYYSLWFNKAVPEARNYCIEPDAASLEVGIKNFLINNAQATFMHAGVSHSEETTAYCDIKTKGNH